MRKDSRQHGVTKEDVVTREELENETGVSARNIRFLISEGLLPPPEGSGRGAWYTPQHAAMLKAYACAKAEGIGSLSVVGRRMAAAAEPQARPVERIAVFDGLALEAVPRRIREIGLEEAVQMTRKALEALVERENE